MTLRKWTEEIEITPQLAAGRTYNVELSKIQQVRDGRPVHLLGFELETAMQYDVSGNPANALPGAFVRSVLANIVLRSGDHRWIDALDGDEVHLLSELRRGNVFDGQQPSLASLVDPLITSANAAAQTGAYVQADVQTIATLANELKTDVNTIATLVNQLKEFVASLAMGGSPGDPADIAAVNAADVARTETIRYLCSDLGLSPRDGAIPLALLDEKKGANGLWFTVAKGFKGSANYTLDHATVTVRAILATFDEVRFPTPHVMRAWDEARTDFQVMPEGRVLSLFIRDTTRQDGSIRAPDHSGYDGLTITLDNEVIQHSRTVADLVREFNERARLGERKYSTSTPPLLPISIARAHDKRTNMHSGTFRFEIKTRKDAGAVVQTKSRVLLHETGRNTSTSMANTKRIIGAPVEGTLIEPRFETKGNRGPEHPLADVIDQAAYWPGIFARVPAQKLALKKAGKR